MIETWRDGVLRERWNDATRVYTRWNAAGVQVEQRAYTAAENTQADARAAAEALITNRSTLEAKAAAGIAANTTDQAQAETVRAAANTLAGTTGTFTTAQASTHIRSLAGAVRTLAEHDVATKRQLNTLIRLVSGLLESTDGT
jgi:hypothetical protein